MERCLKKLSEKGPSEVGLSRYRKCKSVKGGSISRETRESDQGDVDEA